MVLLIDTLYKDDKIPPGEIKVLQEMFHVIQIGHILSHSIQDFGNELQTYKASVLK